MATSVPTITVGGVVLDPCSIVLPLQIIVGRSSVTRQPDAPQCSFIYRGPVLPFTDADPITITLDTGYQQTATWGDATVRWADPDVTWAGARLPALTRFRGEVNSTVAVEAHGGVNQWRVACVGRSARTGRLPLDIEFGASTDWSRVRGIATFGDYPISISGSKEYAMAPVDVDSSVAAALQQVAASTGAIVVEDQHGTLWYQGADARLIGVSAVLPMCALLDGVEWDRSPDDVINEIRIGYGPQDARAETTIIDAPSQDVYGPQASDADTQLAGLADASAVGATIMLRRATAWWQVQGVLIHSDLITDPADWWTVNRLRPGDGVILPVSVEPGPIPGPPTAWTVEGWMERWDTRHRQSIQLALSDRRRWGDQPLQTWAGMRDGGTWAHWADGSWLDALNGLGI